MQNERKMKMANFLFWGFFFFHFLRLCYNSLLQRHLGNVLYLGTGIQECSSKSLLLDKPFSQQRDTVC